MRTWRLRFGRFECGLVNLPYRRRIWAFAYLPPRHRDVWEVAVSWDQFKFVSPWLVLMLRWHHYDPPAHKWHEHGSRRAWAVIRRSTDS